MRWIPSADSDYEKILKKNPEKAIENYDDLRAFENRCLNIFLKKAALPTRCSMDRINNTS